MKYGARNALVAVSSGLLGAGISYLYFRQQRKQTPTTNGLVPTLKSGDSPSTTLPVPGRIGNKPLSQRQQQLLKYGVPNPMQLQIKQNYISMIDFRLKEPIWVIEHLTKDNVKGPAERGNISFSFDRDIPDIFRSHNEDYFKSGYSRGHMSPASNNKSSMEAMRESFLLSSNIVPQDLDNNMFYWHRMEIWVKDLVLKKGFDHVYVMSGPLFLPVKEDNSSPQNNGTIIDTKGKVLSRSNSLSNIVDNADRALPVPAGFYSPPSAPPSSSKSAMVPAKPFAHTRYRMIGDSNVAVPTHLFKAVLAEKYVGADKPPQLFYASFVVPNTPIAAHLPLRMFQVPRELLERYAGFFIFDQAFTAASVLDLCTVVDPAPGRKKNNGDNTICSLMSPQVHQYFGLDRDMSHARSLEELEKSMAAMRRLETAGDITIESRTLATYEKKKKQLSGQ